MTSWRGTVLNFLLGFWLGGSVVLWGVVGYNFAGIPRILQGHEELARRAELDPDHAEFKTTVKTSTLWVYSSELNRAFFTFWGRAQLVLAGLALVVALMGRHGVVVPTLILLAGVVVVYAAFWQIPEIIDVGTSLDFVPRDPPLPLLAKFHELHRLSLLTDFGRGGLVLLAAGWCAWRAKNGSATPDQLQDE